MHLLKVCLFAAVMTVATSIVAAEPNAVPDGDEAGFVPLFDGKSLSGWHPHLGVPKAHIGGKWSVKDGC